MSLWNLGSIQNAIVTRIDNVPEGISGALIEMANETRQDILQYTGLDPGSVDIQLKFQPVMYSLTAAETLGAMHMTGIDATSIRLGDLTVKKGTNSNTKAAQQFFQNKGEKQLQRIGRKSHYYKAFG